MLAAIIPFLNARGKHRSAHANAIAEMGCALVEIPIFGDRMSDREHAIRIFKEHINEVQSEIPADRLLTFNIRDGWKPLCEFLRVTVPDFPFPKTNSSKQFHGDESKG